MARKIKVNALIALFEQMEQEKWVYVFGGARRGEVDCSGAFVFAYRTLAGLPLEHSSNFMARRSVVPGSLTKVSELSGRGSQKSAAPGWAAFKWKATETPERWQRDGRGNFYHVGLVDGSGRWVLNAKGTRQGFCRERLSAYDFVAPLRAVRYA